MATITKKMEVTLALDADEANALNDLLRHGVVGPMDGRRQYLDRICSAFDSVGMGGTWPTDMTGTIWFSKEE